MWTHSRSKILETDLRRYWHQGYSIFSKYDEGIWMTDDAWFGVTHESVAHKIAKHIAQAAPDDRAVIIDPFCGVGGNTIALALSGRWKRVYAIEKDPATLACARHNAEIYGVGDKITWFEGDCFDILGLKQGKEADTPLATLVQRHGVIFASPPWGGKTQPSLLRSVLTGQGHPTRTQMCLTPRLWSHTV